MKYLNGRELAGYIKERQAKQVRVLRQSKKVNPKLAIISTADDKGSEIYMRLKKQYGEDIQVEVNVHRIDQAQAIDNINQLNNDDSVHGIIVQLPLADSRQLNEILNSVAPHKDVDGLATNTEFFPATPMAIDWLLEGYNVNKTGKHILIVGQGKLVGSPLSRLWKEQGFDIVVADINTKDLKAETIKADIIVTATGKPGLINSDMIKKGAVVLDAGVAESDGQTKGDLADDVYQREDLTLTPQKGGVGPLTVCALMENVIKGASRE